MVTAINSLELRFSGSDYGLSARRLWELTEMGQINPFVRAISARRELNNASAFIDVVCFDGDTFALAGFSLDQLLINRILPDCVIGGNAALSRQFKSQQGNAFIHAVAVHLDRCSIRQAVRNQHHEFLPAACAADVFGVPHIFSTLLLRLQSIGKSRASGKQWLKTVGSK